MKYLVIIPACLLSLSFANKTLAQTVVPPAHSSDSVFNEKDRTYYRDPIKDTSVKSQKKSTTDSLSRRKSTKKPSSVTPKK